MDHCNHTITCTHSLFHRSNFHRLLINCEIGSLKISHYTVFSGTIFKEYGYLQHYTHSTYHLWQLINTDLLVEHVLMANLLLLGAAASAVALARGILLWLILRNVGEGASTFLIGGAHLLRRAFDRRSLTLLSVGSNNLQHVQIVYDDRFILRYTWHTHCIYFYTTLNKLCPPNLAVW